MDMQSRIALVEEVGEEILTRDDLVQLFETKSVPIAYDGFEPSGKLHIAQGIMRAINVNKMLKAGCRFKMWVADWFGWMNNKMGGDLEKIRTVGEYQIEVWKACGMDTDGVEFLWAKDVMADDEYWKKVIQIARHSTLQRIIRCGQIMGRGENEMLSAAQVFYPCMQCADIFHLEADIAQLGMDQRKVNVLAREIGPKIGFFKPVVVSHHMLMGLGQPPEGADSIDRKIEMKMSKSVPGSAIFMTDSKDEIQRKIKKAYCPEKQTQDNPILDYARHLIFERYDSMEVPRPEKFGGDLLFEDYASLEEAFRKGELHPLDLKKAAAEYIDGMIAPVRKHFESGKAKKLLERVNSFDITR